MRQAIDHGPISALPLNNIYQKNRFFATMSQDQKREAIIEAAIKRFAHFGVAKTTMAEIAADLAFSKASLYYYFPDKLSLFAAVFQTITDASVKAGDEELSGEKDPFKAIVTFLQKRTDFIIKYQNILSYLKSFNFANVPAELESIFSHLKKKELQRLTDIIDKGDKSGVFKIKDPKAIAELFHDFLDGFRFAYHNNQPNFFPDKKQFQLILRKETEFAMIFFNGLTIKRS
jgi:TetR/AcrR family transcriptional repressor of mexJK operon